MNGTRHGFGQFCAILAVFPFLAVSCAVPPGAEVTASVTIRVAEDGTGARGLVYDPAPTLGELTTLLDGDGPGSAGFSSVKAAGGAVELNLAIGDWSFTARAVDGNGAEILSGSASARVEAASGATVTIELSPPDGIGAISVRYAVPAEAPPSARWHCSLSDASGATIRSWVDEIATGARTLAGVPTGYFAFSIQLIDGSVVLSGSTGLVRVLRGMTTTVDVSVAIPNAAAGIGLQYDERSPLSIGAARLSRAAVRGFPIRAQASGPSGALYRWSSQGTVLAEGSIVDISTMGLPREGAVDLCAFSGFSAGAAELAYTLEEPTIRAGWSLYATVTTTEEPGSQVLARPAMLSSSENGDVLGIATDGASSKVELWIADATSGEMVPASSVSIRIGGSARKATTLSVSPLGDYVAAANSESGWIWLAPADENGALGAPVELVGGSAGLESLAYVRGLCFSPDSTRLFALSNADRSVYVFERNDGTWSLASRTSLDAFPCGTLSVLKAMAVSSDGSALAIAAAGSDAVAILDVVATGLSWRGEARRSAGFSGLDYPQALAFSPNGTALAVACKDSAALVLIDPVDLGPSSSTLYDASSGLVGTPYALAFTRDGSAIGMATDAGLAVLCLPDGLESARFGLFDAADAPALAAPKGIAMVYNAFYAACPDGAALAIVGKPNY